MYVYRNTATYINTDLVLHCKETSVLDSAQGKYSAKTGPNLYTMFPVVPYIRNLLQKKTFVIC